MNRSGDGFAPWYYKGRWDTHDYLEKQGWERIQEEPDRYLGRFKPYGIIEADDLQMHGALERTVSGRRKFYVLDPPPGFVALAEDGDCLMSSANPKVESALIEDAREVHFNPKPDSFGAGIRKIERLLAEVGKRR
jgi:hypothetical protein